MARRKRDYYVVLGVAKDASEADIKRAFRELARKHHPDIAAEGDDGERFREINEAYTVLSDRDNRARYDRWGHADDNPGGLSAVVDAARESLGGTGPRAHPISRRRLRHRRPPAVHHADGVARRDAVTGGRSVRRDTRWGSRVSGRPPRC